MNKEDKEKIEKAILTLDVLIDCNKEDGTYYNAKKEWEALDVFKDLFQRIDKAIEYLKEHSFDYDTEDMIFDKANAYELLRILKGDSNE